MKWEKEKPAPQDGRCILGKFDGYPIPKMASWNVPCSVWVVAELNVGLYKGVYNDTYFENEYHKESELVEWVGIE